MHELSIAENILDLVKDHVQPPDYRLVSSVKVRIGALAGVVPDSLEFCFSAITSETPFVASKLEIERVPAVMECSTCDSTFPSEMGIVLCPRCGNGNTKLISGTELQVAEIELLDPADTALST
jgi:hydrogenase nickel incorporation protein HypA/HybF